MYAVSNCRVYIPACHANARIVMRKTMAKMCSFGIEVLFDSFTDTGHFTAQINKRKPICYIITPKIKHHTDSYGPYGSRSLPVKGLRSNYEKHLVPTCSGEVAQSGASCKLDSFVLG